MQQQRDNWEAAQSVRKNYKKKSHITGYSFFLLLSVLLRAYLWIKTPWWKAALCKKKGHTSLSPDTHPPPKHWTLPQLLTTGRSYHLPSLCACFALLSTKPPIFLSCFRNWDSLDTCTTSSWLVSHGPTGVTDEIGREVNELVRMVAYRNISSKSRERYNQSF